MAQQQVVRAALIVCMALVAGFVLWGAVLVLLIALTR